MGTEIHSGQHRPPSPTTTARLARDRARAALWATLKPVLATPSGLALVNRLHRALSLASKRRFFYFAFDESCRVEGPWIADFGGRRLVLPLHRDFALAWIAAIGFHGYDTEVHELYEWLVGRPRAPRVVFDVGANYGLHSLKFLAHGARVLSFEPNQACHAFLLESASCNGVRADIRAVALGRARGVATLVVPDGRTYLGTTAPAVAARWSDAVDVATRSVTQVSLDEIVEREGLVPDLVKIDTEGSELEVLEGARTTLARRRPLLVLESWRADPARPALFRLLATHGYRLHALRFGLAPSGALALSDFLASPATNFVARPLATD